MVRYGVSRSEIRSLSFASRLRLGTSLLRHHCPGKCYAALPRMTDAYAPGLWDGGFLPRRTPKAAGIARRWAHRTGVNAVFLRFPMEVQRTWAIISF